MMLTGLKKIMCLLMALVLIAGTAYAEGWICPDCSRENDAEFMFCPACGGKPADDTQNTAQVMIDGEEYTFYLGSASVSKINLNVYYYAFSPRGEYQYMLWMKLAPDADTGVRYDSTKDKYGTHADDVTLVLYTRNYGSYGWGGEYHMGYAGEGEAILEMDSRSDDWMTYSGKAAARGSFSMKSQRESDITLTMEFDFTIGEIHPYAEEMIQKLESGNSGHGELEDIFDDIGISSSATAPDAEDDNCYSCGGSGICQACNGAGYTYTLNFGNGSQKRDCGLCSGGECKYCQ